MDTESAAHSYEPLWLSAPHSLCSSLLSISKRNFSRISLLMLILIPDAQKPDPSHVKKIFNESAQISQILSPKKKEI